MKPKPQDSNESKGLDDPIHFSRLNLIETTKEMSMHLEFRHDFHQPLVFQ